MLKEARNLEREKDSTDERPSLEELERRAASHLASALEIAHQPARRDDFRQLLELAIVHARSAVTSAGEEPNGLVTAARSTLVKAYAAKAQDALHGAGQLSLSAQRAPTREACNEGWSRVEAIVAGAEAAARDAAACLTRIEGDAPRPATIRAARASAHKAEAVASAARKLVEQRNHAYTFHTDGGFSFGEGWYLAAAAVLAGVAIQIEPAKAGTAQAEKFLRDAGLSHQIQHYRSRPRAMKHVTALVARAFKEDPASAQRRLRAAFLGEAPLSLPVMEWVDRRLEGAERRARDQKVLLWVRGGVHHAGRNTVVDELLELSRRVQQSGLAPILTGDALQGATVPEGAIDMILFWQDPVFRQLDTRRAQLQFFEYLRRRHGVVGQLGVTTAGMDGPALMGLPTMYLTDAPNVRMREWVGAVPGYEEVVRATGYLEHISQRLVEWASSGPRSSVTASEASPGGRHS